MNNPNKFSSEVRERAARLAQEHRGEYPWLWAAVESIAPRIGGVPQTVLEWIRREEAEAGVRDDLSTSERERLKALEREVKQRRTPWKTRESVELATLQWVCWFNHYRLPEPIGHMPPAEAEANYWKQQAIETGLEVST